MQSIAEDVKAARDLVVSLGGVPAYSVGGYTGPGAIDEPAGIVHKGEVVWSQDDVARAGGVQAVESLRLGGLPGWPEGGAIGLPAISIAATQALIAVFVALRAEFVGLRAEARATAVNTGKSTRLLQRVTQDGEAMQTVAT